MAKLTRFLQMSDGHQIFVRLYEPKGTPIGHFHILHGMAEHGGRYDPFADTLCELGYFVTVHDHRGHGKTAEENGILGYFADKNGFHRVVEDVREIIQYFQKDREISETVLFGHSMGSFIVRRFIQLYSHLIDKCILSGTGATTVQHRFGYMLAKTLSAVQGKTTKSYLMTRLSFGSFNKQFANTKTAFDWLSTDEQEIINYIEDTNCGFIPTNQFFVDLTKWLLVINRSSENDNIRKDLPVLLISGSEDPLGNKGIGIYKVANQLKKAGLENVVVYLLEGMRHEILKEKNKEHVYHVISRWLNNDRRERN